MTGLIDATRGTVDTFWDRHGTWITTSLALAGFGLMVGFMSHLTDRLEAEPTPENCRLAHVRDTLHPGLSLSDADLWLRRQCGDFRTSN